MRIRTRKCAMPTFEIGAAHSSFLMISTRHILFRLLLKFKILSSSPKACLGEARPVRAEVNKDDPLITQPVFVLFIKQAVQPCHQNSQGDGLFFTFPPSAFHHVALRTRLQKKNFIYFLKTRKLQRTVKHLKAMIQRG